MAQTDTATTEELRDLWAAELAAAKAEALREAAEAYPAITRDMVSRGSVKRWLATRADEIERTTDG